MVPPVVSQSQVTGSSDAAANAVAATGDPHMQNIFGQRFDLMQPGKHTLLQIPRAASDSDALLRVMADAEHEGGACADMYFKALNITGEWVSAHQKDGYMYTADAPQSWHTANVVKYGVPLNFSLLYLLVSRKPTRHYLVGLCDPNFTAIT